MNTKTLLLISALALPMAAQAADATLHQVYEATRAGRTAEAHQMMEQVLKDHPESAKAHYVYAEVLAAEGRLQDATNELATAERLKPGLPFAKPDSVQTLRQRLAGKPVSASAPGSFAAPHLARDSASPSSGLPWGWIIGGLGVVLAIVMAMRNRRPQPVWATAGAAPGAAPMPAAGGWSNTPSYSSAGPGYGHPMPPPAQGGLGSGLMGSLATGAAVGAGVVAGEALMHRVLGGDHETRAEPVHASYPVEEAVWRQPQQGDLGGNDFGVSDGGSWDDSDSGGGSDDWT